VYNNNMFWRLFWVPGVRTARLLAAVMRGLRRWMFLGLDAAAITGGSHHGAWSCGAVPETTAPRSPSGVVIASPCRPGSASGSLPALSVRRGVGVMQAHPPSSWSVRRLRLRRARRASFRRPLRTKRTILASGWGGAMAVQRGAR
jgi:hypothetical protein